MKKLSSLLTALVFASLVIFISCGGDDGGDPPAVDPLQEAAGFLTGGAVSGAPASVNDGASADATANWSNFNLSLSGNETGGTYTATGVPAGFEAVWPASGTWEFDGNSATRIIRKDGDDGNNPSNVTITLSNLTASTGTLDFSIPDSFTARTSGVAGNWTFTFN